MKSYFGPAWWGSLLFSCSVMPNSLQPHGLKESDMTLWLDSNNSNIDCSPPGFSDCGTSQARILEWVPISLSRGSSWPRDQTCISCFGRWVLFHWATWEIYDGTSAFIKCDMRELTFSFAMWKQNQGAARKKSLIRTWTCVYLALELKSPSCEEVNFCCLNSSLLDFVMAVQTKTLLK